MNPQIWQPPPVTYPPALPAAYFHGLLATPECNNCPLKYDTKVLPDGPIPARLAIVAENPGADEVKKGRGLVGPTGQLTWTLWGHAGVRREDVWVTNSFLCRPRKVTLQNGLEFPEDIVKALAARACRTRLLRELIIVNPRVTVAMGNWALWSLGDIPYARITEYRGSRLERDLTALLRAVETGQCQSPIRQVRAKDEG